jgi:hypothetical protein
MTQGCDINRAGLPRVDLKIPTASMFTILVGTVSSRLTCAWSLWLPFLLE